MSQKPPQPEAIPTSLPSQDSSAHSAAPRARQEVFGGLFAKALEQKQVQREAKEKEAKAKAAAAKKRLAARRAQEAMGWEQNDEPSHFDHETGKRLPKAKCGLDKEDDLFVQMNDDSLPDESFKRLKVFLGEDWARKAKKFKWGSK